MRFTKICPKCDSSDIKRIKGSIRPYAAGNNILVGATIFSAVRVHRYLCCNCGFSEEWIDIEDIEKIEDSNYLRG